MAESILDMGTLEEARFTMKTKFSAVIEYFLEDAENYLDTIRKGLEVSDFTALAVAAHTLKSSSLQLGAIKLGELARQIEQVARNSPNSEEIYSLVAEIEEVFSETSRLIRNL